MDPHKIALPPQFLLSDCKTFPPKLGQAHREEDPIGRHRCEQPSLLRQIPLPTMFDSINYLLKHYHKVVILHLTDY